MRVAHNLRARQAAAVNDAGVIQFVGEDHIFFANQRRHRRQVRHEARLKRNAGLRAFELGKTLFQFNVQAHRPGNGAHGGGTQTIFFNRALRRRQNFWMIRQTQIIVGAEVQNFFAIHNQPRALWRADSADGVIQPLLLE